MTRFMAHSLWLRQTAYTIVVVAIVAFAISGVEVIISYHAERERLQEFGENLIASSTDAAARAAFHVDELQAEAVVEGLMQYEVLDNVSITTDLGVVLAEQSRMADVAAFDFLADWLFTDGLSFNHELSVDRSEFVSGLQLGDARGVISVGELKIHANATVIGNSFIYTILTRIIGLAVEFLVLATALAFIFYRTMTKPLMRIAERLGAIDPQGTDHAGLEHLPSHKQDELGLVVERTNELLKRIAEQQSDLIHREKVAALGSMLAEVAHELNNPLAVVTAQAELLAETATDQMSLDRAQKILRPAKRCADIVRQFLSLARQRKIEKSVLDVRRLISESVELLSYQFSKRNVLVHTDIDADVARVWGDNAQLGQVLINVLVNAQQALSGATGDKEIVIHARSIKGKNKVTISISDNGHGIPHEIRHKVFDHFFTTKPEGRGTGLGLSYCKSVINGHDGSIRIKNVSPHGTEVVIELPSTTQAEVNTVGRAHPGQALMCLRVLVVDDEESLASSISEILTHYGHSAIVANSTEQAMEKLESDYFDVILADVHMPGVDGIDFYRIVRENDSALAEKFIFITGDSLDPGLVDFFDEEKRPWLSKPFEIADLIDAVEQLLLLPKTAESLMSRTTENANVRR